MKDVSFLFHKTAMSIRLTTAETGGAYSVVEMRHIANVGPALHIHPRGPESFLVLEGEYHVTCGDTRTRLGPGQSAAVPAGTPHRYVTGAQGGRLMVICPPGLELYFWEVGRRLANGGTLTLEEEFAIAARCGQDFLDGDGHWGHQ